MPGPAKPIQLAVCISGSGTNLQAILNACAEKQIDARVAVVFSNIPNATGLERAAKVGVPTEVLNHTGMKREEFDSATVALLGKYKPDLVCLAGYMRVITPVFLNAFPHKVMNIHPALLPSFPGTHAQEQAFNYGVRVTGCTTHFVDPGTDTGPVICQETVPVLDDDTVDTLKKRILAKEHVIYPKSIQLFAEGRLKIQGRKVIILPK